MNNLKWCAACLSMSTRPRITFNEDGLCNACVWTETKKHLNWSQRENELSRILDEHRRNDGSFDCLVPVSGGKDGSYVAYNLKNKYGMNPLCVTITPPLPLDLGEKNLKSFVQSGYNHISVNPDSNAMKTLNKLGFQEMGFPYYGWLTSITVAPIRIAVAHDIQLIFYGEDGEVEYGGSSETLNNPIYSVEYQKEIYLEGGYDKIIQNSNLSKSQTHFFEYPAFENVEKDVSLTHWSYFENWDPYRNYLIAKEHCGLVESENTNSGTFTNFSQNDQALYSLHTYLMYLKFGFGRANQDASIEIRRGAMSRDQGLNLVQLYDGTYPEEFISLYLEYYEMTSVEFDEVLNKFANKNLFVKENNKWTPKFKIK